MTLAAATVPDTDEPLRQLADEVRAIAEELRLERAQRARWADLVHEMSPVTTEAFAALTRELDDLSDVVTTENLVRFGRTMARALPTMEALLAQLESLNALGGELAPLASPAMASLTTTLQQLDEKGYFAFARGGAGIVDRVVTSFTEEDVAALGDNVVLILNTVKEMTQPEVMTLLQRTAVTVQEVEDVHASPPSMFALLKQMRDPQTRRGLGRVMTMLRTVGQESPAAASPSHEER